MVGCEVEGPLWVVLGRSRGLGVRSWVALGASAGDLGSLLNLCRRSWAAFGAFVGDLGPLLGPLLAVVGHLGPKSGPNPSGKTIWQADLGREVAQTRAGRHSRGRKSGGAGGEGEGGGRVAK